MNIKDALKQWLNRHKVEKIFVDIDGTLHVDKTDSAPAYYRDDVMEALKWVKAKFPDIEINLISARKLEEMTEYNWEGFSGRIPGPEWKTINAISEGYAQIKDLKLPFWKELIGKAVFTLIYYFDYSRKLRYLYVKYTLGGIRILLLDDGIPKWLGAMLGIGIKV